VVDDFRPQLADTLAAITAAVLGAASTGVMLADPRGGIEVVAATDEHAMLVEVLQAQTEQGPCVDCIRKNTLVTEFDLSRARLRWPQFAPAATAAGYHAIIAVPMRLHALPVGGLNLLYTDPPPPDLGPPRSRRSGG
jgi:GAF domain-containing protein